MPLVLKMATPQQRSWCVLQLAKKRFCNSCATCMSHIISRSLPELRQRIKTATAFISRDTEQSLGRVGLSSRHLPYDSRSTYRVSVRCVQNFESFSIDWCRCEVLSTTNLFSVSFLKWKVLLCSPYTLSLSRNALLREVIALFS
jgi:hypothetical protein